MSTFVGLSHSQNCEPLTDAAQSLGSACAEVQKRVTDAGSVNGYRARVTVIPAAGHWLKPTIYSWSSDGALSQVCSGGCAQQTSAWTSAWSPVRTTAGTYTVRGEISGGYVFDVAASWSSWARVAEKRATYAVGKWIEPRWVRVGTVMNGTNTHKTHVLCTPSCTRRTTGWSTSVTRTIPGLASPLELYASAKVALPSGAVRTIKASLFD